MKNKELLKNLKVLSKLTKKNSLPILNYIFFENGEMKATDLENTAVFKTDFTGTFFINGETLNKICSKLGNEEITFTQDEKSVEMLIDGVSKFLFEKEQFITSEDYPVLVSEENMINDLNLDQTAYQNLFRAVKFSTNDNLRPALQGVFIGEHIVATDSHLLIYIKNSEIPVNQIIVRQKLFDLMDQKAELKAVRYDSKNILFEFDNCRFISRLIEDKFPTYQRVIPKKKTITGSVTLNAKELLKNIDLALISNYSGFVRFSFKNTLMLRAVNIDENIAFKTELSGKKSGDDIEIGFDGNRVKLAVKDYDEVTFKYSDAGRAVIINDELLLMPMMLSD